QVAADMIQTGAQNLLTLSNSFQDLLRRGLPLQPLAASLAQALEGPQAALAAIRPVPDILTAFAKRIRALGAAPPPPTVKAVDYRRLLERRRQVQDDE
ncbi:MAG: hypothetical protein ACKVPX_08450, partial [Myxococcaceae bacterium]